MRLLTELPPRVDGVVLLQASREYEFKPAADGLACDIEDEVDFGAGVGLWQLLPG